MKTLQALIAAAVLALVGLYLTTIPEGRSSEVARLRRKLALLEGSLGRGEAEVAATTIKTRWLAPVTVALCLSDATHDNLEEMTVAIKSLLYQAPPPGSRTGLDIHIVTGDDKTTRDVIQLLNESKVQGTLWHIPISITTHNVSALGTWMRDKVVRSTPLKKFGVEHYIGAWWRLILPWILPASVSHCIYVDIDVWFRDSISGMWLERNNTTMLQWGPDQTSGVLMLNLRVMKEKMWRAYGRSGCAAMRENRKMNRTDGPYSADWPIPKRMHISPRTGDQAFLQTIVTFNPELEGRISKPYVGLHYAWAWKLSNKRLGGQADWWNTYEGASILHMNGRSARSKSAYWRDEQGNSKPIWRNALFYADAPWHWLLYHSTIYNKVLGIKGYRLEIQNHIVRRGRTFDRISDDLDSCWKKTMSIVNDPSRDCREIL